MSAKYDLLANSKISDFDAVEVSGSNKNGCKLSKIVVIVIVAVIITTILLTLLTVIVIEATKHRPNTSPHPPITQCPSAPPQIMVPCSNTGHYNKDQCTAVGCCWYDTDQCVLSNYSATCPTTNSIELFTCLPENDDWNNSYAMAQCNKRGCCWNKSPDSIVRCYYPSEYGYIATNIQDTSNGKQVTIERRSPQPSLYGNDIQQLTVQVTYETSDILRVKVRTIWDKGPFVRRAQLI